MADEVEQTPDAAVAAPAEASPEAAAPAVTAPEAPAEREVSEVSEEPKTRRAGLDDIYEKKLAREKDATPVEKQRAAAGQAKRGPDGKFLSPQPKEALPTAVAPQVAKPPPGVSGAPRAWSKEERKHWDAIPVEAKKVIARRETEHASQMQKVQQEAAATWKPYQDFSQKFVETIKPFEHLMRQEAATSGRQYSPLWSIGQLLNTGAQLRHHDPRVKASVVASIIQTYGVDPNHIADVLEGKQPSTAAQAPQAPRQPVFDPQQIEERAVARVRQEFQQQAQQRHLAVAQAEVEDASSDFEKYPHFEDVREVMADIIDAHAKRMERLPEKQRVAMGMPEAYRLACMMDPELAASVQQAEAPASEEAPAGEPAKPAAIVPKQTASSIRSRPGGRAAVAPAAPKGRRETLERLLNQKFSPQQ